MGKRIINKKIFTDVILCRMRITRVVILKKFYFDNGKFTKKYVKTAIRTKMQLLLTHLFSIGIRD